MAIKDKDHALEEALANPKVLVIWTGAGISYDSGVPIADDLVKFILQNTFDKYAPYIPGRIVEIYGSLYRNKKRIVPRLEFILGCIEEVFHPNKLNKPHKLSELLQLFGLAEPCSAHEWVAEQGSKGCKVITANFDKLIEKIDSLVTVFHYHSTYDDPKCGATLSQIALGFRNNIEKVLDEYLLNSRNVIFIGYSGRDYYDTIPFLKQRTNRYETAIWISYKKGLSPIITNNIPSDLEVFQKSFREFIHYEGDPRFIYKKLSYPTDKEIEEKKKKIKKFVSEVFNNITLQDKQDKIVLGLHFLEKMRIDGLAYELVAKIESKKQIFFPNIEERKEYNRYAVSILNNANKFKSAFRILSKIRNTQEDIPKDFILAHKIEGALWGFDLLRLIGLFFSILHCDYLWKKLKDEKISPDEVELLHNKIYVPHYIRKHIPYIKRILSFSKKYQEKRKLMYSQYEKMVLSDKILYDEDLAQRIRFEAGLGPRENEKFQDLPKRWEETDNLLQVMNTRRQVIQNKIEQGKKPSSWEVIKGVYWLHSIGCNTELILWLALADRYAPRFKRIWKHHRQIAVLQLEVSFIRKCILYPKVCR